MSLRCVLISAVVAVAAVPAGCGGEPARAACGPVVGEQLDPNQGHLIVGAREPTYLTDPPTSGPHVAGLVSTGVRPAPMTGIEQVSTLEAGVVIVQHQGIGGADRRALQALAGPTVAVAPGRGLPSPIVATGWLRKQRCDRLDLAALRSFIAQVGGRVTGHTTPPTTGAATTTAVPATTTGP